jgi:WD40 repeat protein
MEHQLELISLEVIERAESVKSRENKKIKGLNLVNPTFGEELYTLDHDTKILTVTFSPDGKKLVSGGGDGAIKLWDVNSGTEIQRLLGHQGGTTSLSFSPDGTTLASGSWDNTIRLWNVTDENVVSNKTLSNHTWVVFSAEFSPDGTILVSADGAGEIKVWNSTNWEELTTFKAHQGEIRFVHFSPDSTLLATASNDGTIKIWNTSTWDIPKPIPIHTLEFPNPPYKTWDTWVMEAKFSSDGKILASAFGDNMFWIWDWDNENVTHKLEGHTHVEYPETDSSVDFSPSEMLLASGGGDGFIKLWDVNSGTEIEIPSMEHNGLVRSVVFSPDGTLLATSSDDSTVKLWNIARGAELQTLAKHTSAVTSVDYSPNGMLLASGSDDSSVKVWNITSGTELQTLQHEDVVTSVDFSYTGDLLVSSSRDETIKLWNVSSGVLTRNLTEHTGFVFSAIFSENGKMVASGGVDANVILWNASNGGVLKKFTEHSASVLSVAFSPNGQVLASGSGDRTTRLWNTTTREELPQSPLEGHKESVTFVKFSPDDKTLATASEDSTIKLWDVVSGKELHHLTGHSRSVRSVAFSSDSLTLISGSEDGTIQVWNVSSGERLETYYLHNVKVYSVDFSPDGKTIAAGASSTIRLWDTNVIPDFDLDGIPDSWELQFSSELDPSDYWDKFDDDDDDGLMNSLEFFLGTYPNNSDSDYDNMTDGWEYLGGLDPIFNDSSNDNDGDGMSNLYEYQMGLNPRVNDAALDKDSDNLTNYQEYLLGLNATNSDSDYDGMRDDWEVDYDLDPTVDDANGDPDGDWVINIDEYRYKSDPQDFWSVPLFAFSAYLLIRVMILLIIAAIGVVMFLNYRNNQRKAFINSLAAPDYTTALKIQRSGYSDYPSFLKAEDDAKTLVGTGSNSYYQGDYLKAIQLYEQALTVFERTENTPLFSYTIFRIVHIMKEKQELTTDSSILKLFPQLTFAEPVIKAIDHMIKALLAEAKKNWGLANEAWQAALTHEGLDDEFKLFCQGAIIEYEVRTWLDNPVVATLEPIIIQLNDWENACKINKQFGNLCQAYLLHARVALASSQFKEMEDWLKKCLQIAEENELEIYQDIVRTEKEEFLYHKERMSSILEAEKPVTPEEQIQLLQEYIKTALSSLEREDLK